MSALVDKLINFRRPLIFTIVALGHLILLFYFRINVKSSLEEAEPVAQVMKLVDVEEYIPPPPPPPEPVEPEEKIVVSDQPAVSEKILEVEQEVIESDQGIPVENVMIQEEPEYLPQHKISKVPDIPSGQILDRIVYPPIALRQELEAVVYLELFIDETGNIRKVEVLRDPGNGFAEAALAAIEGLQCGPAEANGKAVAVRFRYPIRFSLSR